MDVVRAERDAKRSSWRRRRSRGPNCELTITISLTLLKSDARKQKQIEIQFVGNRESRETDGYCSRLRVVRVARGMCLAYF